MMTLTAPPHGGLVGTRKARPSPVARRIGYVIGAAVNVALLYAVHVWPGWQAVPFLTEDTRQVLGLVTLSLIAGLVANIIYIAYDAPRWKALGDLVTTAIGVAVMVRVWQVFPFAFTDTTLDWPLVVRVVLVVGIVGAVIGMIVQLVTLVRGKP
jgi:hypothetical protein